jgi:hypothetical protein
MSERSWKPGDPDRRRGSRSLLDATGTSADEHLPAEPEVRAHGEWVVIPLETDATLRSRWKALLRRLQGPGL